MGELLMLDLLRAKREDYYFWEEMMDLSEEKKRWDCLKLCLKRKKDSIRRKVLAVECRNC